MKNRNKKMTYEQWYIKKNNQDHAHGGRWVVTGHNGKDAEFLSGNKEALQILQHNLA